MRNLRRALQAPQAAIVEPPPRVDAASARKLGEINIGHSQVVAPAPELPVAEQYAVAGGSQQALGTVAAALAVVPPPPSIQGNAAPTPEAGSSRSVFIPPPSRWKCQVEIAVGHLPRLLPGRRAHPALPTFRPTQITGSGSGSGAGKSNGLPSGLTVGAGPDDQTTSARVGTRQRVDRANDNSRLIADATPPRVSASAPFGFRSLRRQGHRCRSLDFRRQEVLRHDPEHAEPEFRGRKLGHSFCRTQRESATKTRAISPRPRPHRKLIPPIPWS